MTRLPVFGVFWRAISFTILELPSIVRLTWLPLGLMALVSAAGAFAIFDSALSELVSGYEPWSPGPALQPYYEAFAQTHVVSAGFLQLIASAAAAVAVHRIVLFGDRQPGRYFAFPYGWTELLYTCMAILSSLIIALAVIPFFVLLFLVVPNASFNTAFLSEAWTAQSDLAAWTQIAQSEAQKLSPVQALVLGLSIFAVFILVLWLTIRMFVWPAAVVARKKLSFAYAWFLTKGNAWAIFGLYLLTFVLIVGFQTIVVASFPSAFVSPFAGQPRDGIVLPEKGQSEARADAEKQEASAAHDAPASTAIVPEFGAGVNEIAVAARPAALRNISDAVQPGEIDAFWRWFVLSQIVAFFMNLLGVAYSVGLISYAYRALSDHDPDNPVQD